MPGVAHIAMQVLQQREQVLCISPACTSSRLHWKAGWSKSMACSSEGPSVVFDWGLGALYLADCISCINALVRTQHHHAACLGIPRSRSIKFIVLGDANGGCCNMQQVCRLAKPLKPHDHLSITNSARPVVRFPAAGS